MYLKNLNCIMSHLMHCSRLRGNEFLAQTLSKRALIKYCLRSRRHTHNEHNGSNGQTGKMPAQSQVLRFKKLTKAAYAPVQGSERAAGLDLKSAHDVVVAARGRALVRTDLQICVPSGCYGRVAPRSGLALKNGIDTGAGVIDEDYRGPVGVVLFNHTDNDFAIMAGDRIAQLICEKIAYPQLQEVQDLEMTARGENGFGSTGIKG